MSDRDLSALRSGERVWVVPQKTRNSTTEPEGSFAIVSRVGRNYFYVNRGTWEDKYCRETGASIHSCDTVRINGRGSDAFMSPTQHEFLVHNKLELERLQSRLVDRWGKIQGLPYPVVAAMHNLLDEAMTDDAS